MRRVVLTLLGIVVLNIYSIAQGIDFTHNLDEAIFKAKKENKLVFVDFYTSWCGPCKRLSKEVFPLKEIGNYFNSHFINCKIQCDDKSLGEKLKDKYQIVAFPTLMILDKNGRIIHSMAGAPSAKGLINFAKEASDPAKNLTSIVNKYQSGNRNKEVVKEYFEKMTKARRIINAREDFDIYFNSLSDKDKCTKFIFDLSKLLKVTPYTKVFEYIENNADKYKSTVSKEEIDSFIRMGYLTHLSGYTRKGKNMFEAELDKFKSKGYPFYQEFKDYFYVGEASSTKGIDNRANEYAKRADAFLNKYKQNNEIYTIIFVSRYCSLFWGRDKGPLGIKWMENLLKKERSAKNLKYYMKILIRNLRFDEAKKAALEIRDICIKGKTSTEYIDKEIEKIEQLKSKYKY